MRISIGLELNNEGRALAWALDYPGCFAYGNEGPDAVIGLAQALVRYEEWVRRHGGQLTLGDFDLRIVDTWEVYTINDQFDLQEGGYAVNAWFRPDWKPLSESEIEHGLALMSWSREDLLSTVSGLPGEVVDRKEVGERWSIRGILKHVGGAEWWYMDRLDLPRLPREQLPIDAFERLAYVRASLIEALPGLAGKDLVLGKEGEIWSPRKLLRRVIWHELDHQAHIERLLRQEAAR